MSDGGIDKIFAGWGTPQSPLGKKPWREILEFRAQLLLQCQACISDIVICSAPSHVFPSRGRFKGGAPPACTPSYFCRDSDAPLFLQRHGTLTLCGCLGTTAFLLKKCLCPPPPIKNSWVHPSPGTGLMITMKSIRLQATPSLWYIVLHQCCFILSLISKASLVLQLTLPGQDRCIALLLCLVSISYSHSTSESASLSQIIDCRDVTIFKGPCLLSFKFSYCRAGP